MADKNEADETKLPYSDTQDRENYMDEGRPMKRALRFSLWTMAFGIPFVVIGALEKNTPAILGGLPFFMSGCAYFCGFHDGRYSE